MTGHGFTSAGLSVESEGHPTTEQMETMLAEDVKANEDNNVEDAYDASDKELDKLIKQEWNKIKDGLKRKEFEHFKEAFILTLLEENKK